eukprot:jgi/Chlat1/5531/Chrsp369S00837
MALQAVNLRQQISHFEQALVAEGVLSEQFMILRQLQDEADSSEFIVEVIRVFFSDADEKIERLSQLVASTPDAEIDFTLVDGVAHQLKGCSATIGVSRVAEGCVEFRKLCAEGKGDAIRRKVEEVREAYVDAKSQLQKILHLELQLIQSL